MYVRLEGVGRLLDIIMSIIVLTERELSFQNVCFMALNKAQVLSCKNPRVDVILD